MKKKRGPCDEIRISHEVLDRDSLKIPSPNRIGYIHISEIVTVVQHQAWRLMEHEAGDPHSGKADYNENEQFPFAWYRTNIGHRGGRNFNSRAGL